jgi:hypothetical protein
MSSLQSVTAFIEWVPTKETDLSPPPAAPSEWNGWIRRIWQHSVKTTACLQAVWLRGCKLFPVFWLFAVSWALFLLKQSSVGWWNVHWTIIHRSFYDSMYVCMYIHTSMYIHMWTSIHICTVCQSTYISLAISYFTPKPVALCIPKAVVLNPDNENIKLIVEERRHVVFKESHQRIIMTTRSGQEASSPLVKLSP